MPRPFFFLFLTCTYVLRIPITLLVFILAPFVPLLQGRILFEWKNLKDQSAKFFAEKEKGICADYCFEVSSEGELEQVRAPINHLLNLGKRLEIIYSSPSVESKCLALYNTHPQQVRLLRLPLLLFFFFSFYDRSVGTWVTAPVIIFCRYDFFPELLLLKLAKKKFILISGAFKKISWYKLSSFKLFDLVVAATYIEKQKFQALIPNAKVYASDFRIPRIAERFQEASKVLATKSILTSYLEKIKQLPLNKKIIMGSAWHSDLEILRDENLIAAVKNQNLHLLVVPHLLKDVAILEIAKTLREIFGVAFVEVMGERESFKGAPVVILQMSGILCELYGHFSLSYVGGGYERSVHSVLEPFLCNNFVVMGPKISRSTEYDLAQEIAPGEIHVLNHPKSFYTIIKSCDVAQLNLGVRREWRERAADEMKLIFQEIVDDAQ